MRGSLVDPSFRRKTIRLAPANYASLRVYFVTICCHKRQRAFLNANLANRTVALFRECAERCHFALHAYCIMPDHVHLLAEGVDPESSLPGFIDDFKHRTAFEFQSARGKRLWQSHFYDHILRKRDSQDAIAWYVWMNPVRKGITADPWEYWFSGSFTMNWKNRLRPPSEWTPPWKNPKGVGG